MFTLVVFFLVLSLLVIIHELGHFFAAKKNNVFVEEFGFGLPPRIFGIKVGETLFSLNWLPFGGFVKVLGEDGKEGVDKKLPANLANRTFFSKGPKVKLAILTAGVVANFLLGWLIVSYLFTKGVPVPTSKINVEKVSPRSPAANAGIDGGDQIKAILINDKQIAFKNIDHFVTEIKKATGRPVELIIEKNNKEKTVTITPRKNPPTGEGALGVVLSPFALKKYPVYTAPFYGLVESVKITGMVLTELSKAVVNLILNQQAPKDIAGPVGIAKITSEAVKYGYTAVLQLISILSLNLAVINILPFPALDGGRVAFVLYETITKKKIRPDIEKKLNMAGFAILLSLIVLVTISDVLKLLK